MLFDLATNPCIYYNKYTIYHNNHLTRDETQFRNFIKTPIVIIIIIIHYYYHISCNAWSYSVNADIHYRGNIIVLSIIVADRLSRETHSE